MFTNLAFQLGPTLKIINKSLVIAQFAPNKSTVITNDEQCLLAITNSDDC